MKRKILIIDDEPAFTRSVRRTLESTDRYEVMEVNAPGMALEAIRSFVPDMVLLDVIMPEIDGGEVLAQVRADASLKAIPVLLLTAIVSKNEVEAGNGRIGGEFFISKPVTEDTLIQSIEGHLAGLPT